MFRLLTGLGFEILVCVGCVAVMSFLFVITCGAGPGAALCSVPIAFLPSIAIALLDKNLLGLYRVTQARIGRLQAGFLAFFACLLGVVVVFLLLLGYPMALVFGWLGMAEMAPHYVRWAVHLGIVIAIICWLRCLFRKAFTPAGLS